MKRINKKTGLIIMGLSILCLRLFIMSSVYAEEIPNSPSDVYIDTGNNVLMVQKPNDTPKLFIIKGVTWSAATRAPANGPNPLNPNETTPYGFFFEYWNTPGDRNPPGHEVFNYWLGNQLKEHYLTDIPLMKQMNVNTVRLYHNLEDNITFSNILDEFYKNDIMVIVTVGNSKDDLEDQFYVYKDKNSTSNHFIPSGWMGDYGDLSFNDATGNPRYGQNCIKITYTAKKSQGQGWAGIYWQQPANNWGTIPNAGYNLTGAKRLTFWAKGETGRECITFKVGGITGPYGDSGYIIRGIPLSNTWQKYTIDLTGINLSYIIGGFSFTVGLTPQTFYLDEIRYEGNDIYCQLNERKYEKIVNLYKNHPAVLTWAIGNEWNLNKFYDDNWSLDDAAIAVNLAAQKIKELDPHHPVCSILGDKFDNNFGSCPPVWIIPDILQRCPNIDLWGLNIYRGNSFGNLFEQWKTAWQSIQPAKPFYVSEFGIDSFNSTSYTSVGSCPPKADDVVGTEDQQAQADVDSLLWNEIKEHLSLSYSGQLCLGGLIHEFNDELWKVGSYHVGLGGLVDYEGSDNISGTPDDNHSYDDYNSEGFVLLGSSPDNVLNEERFGLMNADRIPKLAYTVIKKLFQPEPDLAVTGLTFSISDPNRAPRRLDSITFTAQVTNQSSTSVSDFTIQWELNDVIQYTESKVFEPGQTTATATFLWSSAQLGCHRLTARIIPLQGEINTRNNNKQISLLVDLDGDSDIDIVDIMQVAVRWNTQQGDPEYEPMYDLDDDGDIDIVDIMKVACLWHIDCS